MSGDEGTVHKMNAGRGLLPWLIAIVVFSVAPYVTSLRGGFTLDDWPLIVEQEWVHGLSNIPRAFSQGFLPESFGKNLPYYRPLVTVSYQVDYALWGLNPLGYRVVNLLLNLAVVLLVFVLARRLTRSAAAAGIAALVFAVLPSHAEAVAWISGRTDIISGVFILLGLIAFAAAVTRPDRFSPALAAVCSVSFMLALLSKEQGILLPVLMIAYAWVFRVNIRRADALKWTAALLPALIIYLALRAHAVPTVEEGYYLVRLKERLLSVGIAYAAYLRMMFVPQEMRVVYDIFPIGLRYPALALAAWAVPLGLLALTAVLRRRAPVAAFGSFWVFISLLPVSNIMPTVGPLPAERFVYLASIGSSVFLGWLVVRAYEWRPKSIGVWPLVVMMAAGWFVLYCSMMTIIGARYYQSNLAWAKGIAAANTRFVIFRSAAAQNFNRAGMFEDAVKQYRAAIDLGSTQVFDYTGLARSLRALGRCEEAVDVMERVIEDHPDNAILQYELGVAYAEAGQLASAADAFSKSVEINPRLASAWRNLGKANLELGHYGESVRAYERAFELMEPGKNDRANLEQARKKAAKAGY